MPKQVTTTSIIPKLVIRTKEQRQIEVRPIVNKLNQLHLSPTSNDEIKQLFEKMKSYINDGARTEINIICSSLNIRIIGILTIDTNEKSCVKMESLDK